MKDPVTKIARQILKIANIIPNIPLVIIIISFVVYKIVKHTGIRELILRENEPLPPQVTDYIKKIYPPWLFNSVAIAFWTFITLQILKLYVWFNIQTLIHTYNLRIPPTPQSYV